MAVKYGTTGPNNIPGTSANDTIYGWATGGNASSVSGNDTLTGIGGNDQLFGGTGNDSLTGGTGIDTLVGGVGNDIYVIDSTSDTITEATSGGTDTVQSSVTYTLGANLENLTLIGTGRINGTGNSLNNTITGNAANNTLNGGTGNDTLVGGVSDNTGNDTLYGGDGNDQLSSKNVIVSSPFTGGDVLYGGNGDDSLNGGYGGNNTLNGGSGNDTYTVFTTPADTIVEAANGGTDTVKSLATTYTLGANLENLTLIGTGASSGTGNSLNNTITGNAANNALSSGAGNDTLKGGLGNDSLKGGTGNDTYILDATIYPGFDGDDVSVNASIAEAANQGTDTVELNVQRFTPISVLEREERFTYTLSSNLENLTLRGQATGDIICVGNALDNIIFGGAANNSAYYSTLAGLQGGEGNDKLYGESGDDYLAGQEGKDTLYGGTGDDAYFVDSTPDSIIEYFNEGTDTVYSSSNYTLRDNTNLENLQLTDPAISGTGNSLNNTIYGNSNDNFLYGNDGNDFLGGYPLLFDRGSFLIGDFGSDDYLDGGTGNDSLYGGTGNDYLYGGSNGEDYDEGGSADYLDGGTGNDTLSVYISGGYKTGNNTLSGGDGDDTLSASYNAANNTLSGGDGNDTLSVLASTGNNTLSGGAGNDTFTGGTGIDTLTGSTGADRFYFNNPTDGIDTITDFVVADDTIFVSAGSIDYNFTYGFYSDLTPDAAITAAQFTIGSSAADNSDRFIYNKSTGALFFDSDGTGATGQVQFAKLSTGLAMTNADIFVF